MLDIKFVRENPDLVDKACESRQNAHWDREKFFELDEERRSVIAEVEALQAARNSASKEIGQLMRSFSNMMTRIDTLMDEKLEQGQQIKALEEKNDGLFDYSCHEQATYSR